MNFDLTVEYTREQEEFAGVVREWLDEHIPKDLLSPREITKMSRDNWLKRRELARKLGEKGWLWPGFPRQYDGGGLDASHVFVLNQEMAERELGLPPYYDSGRLAVPAILACATDEQKGRFLPPIFKGEVITWQLFTEPEAGTDEANQQTNALRHVRDNDYFIINGQKIFVGGLYAPPEQFLLLTRSDLEAPRHENLAMFLCPSNLTGITIQPLDLFTAEIFSATSGQIVSGPGVKHTVFFDNVRIPESHMIGGDHDGWKVANATLAVEHGEVDRGISGGREETRQMSLPRNLVVEKFLEQCKSNPNVVKRLKENPQLLDSVVDIYIGREKERLFSLKNAGGIGGRSGGPRLQLYTKQFGNRCIADMARVLGPYALTDDDEWGLGEDIFEVAQRAGVCTAPAGTPEALKIIISRGLAIGR